MPIGNEEDLSRTRRILWLADNPAWIFVPVGGLNFPSSSSLGVLDYLLRGEIRRMVERVESRVSLRAVAEEQADAQPSPSSMGSSQKDKGFDPIWVMGEGFFFRALILLLSPPLPPVELALHLVPMLPKPLPGGIRLLFPPPEIEREIPPGTWEALNDSFPREEILFFSLLS